MTANVDPDAPSPEVAPPGPHRPPRRRRAVSARDLRLGHPRGGDEQSDDESGRITVARIVVLSVAGAALAAVLAVCGIGLGFALAAGLLLVVLSLAWAAYSDGYSTLWPLERPGPRPGARSDVNRLAWAFRPHRDSVLVGGFVLVGGSMLGRGSVRDQAFSAVRSLAATRLARYGLDLAEPHDQDAIVGLLGARAYAALVPPRGILPSPSAVEHCLDALDSLPVPVEGHRTW
jgi:hypothetical protein